MGLFRKLFQKTREASLPFCSAVVVAAGNATRMEGQDKILALLAGEPVIVHTLRALQNSYAIHEIVVVTREDLLVTVGGLCKGYGLDKVSKVVVGGENRVNSVLNGVRETSPRAQLLAIHDGARPLVSGEVIVAAVTAAAKTSAAAPAVPVKDTVKRAADGLVLETVERSQLYAVQTPQVFDSALLKGALEKAVSDGAAVTDDCSAVERLGMTVTLTKGEDINLKITTPADLAAAEGLYIWRANQ